MSKSLERRSSRWDRGTLDHLKFLGPNFLFPAAKDCTLKTAACSNFDFSFPCHGKWLIPQLSLLHEISQTWACNDFLAYSTIGKALSFSQRNWRCGKTRSGSFQWRTVSHTIVHGRRAACWNSEFSCPRHGKWPIPQLSLLYEISQTRACNKFLACSTIGKALSFSQRKWRCGKTRSGSFQWRTVSHMRVCPVLFLVLCMSKSLERRSSRCDRAALDHLPFSGQISISLWQKIVHWRRLHVQILTSHFPVTASGSFHSCRCSMKFLRHGPATIF